MVQQRGLVVNVKVEIHTGKAQVTTDISETRVKPSGTDPGRVRHANVPPVVTPPVVDLTGEDDQPGLNSDGLRAGRNRNPLVASPPLVDLTSDENRPGPLGLASSTGGHSVSPASSSARSATPPVVDLTQELAEEDILDIHVTEEEWQESGFERE
ncbi:uncharacterized protein LOC144870312 [Branchiostoma floridae x Branchiostoma japonicum]